LVILYFVYQKQEAAYQEDCALKGIPAADCSLLGKIISDFKEVNYFWILIVYICFTISNISRSIRWQMLLKPMGYYPRMINVFLSVMLGYFANLGLPRLGEIVKSGTISQYEKIPMEKVIGTVVVDRIIDVFSLLIVIGISLLIEFDTLIGYVEKLGEGKGGAGSLLIYAGIGLMLSGGLFFMLRRKIEQSALFQRLKKIFMGFWEGMLSISRVDRPGWLIFHSVNIWVMYFLMTYLCFFSFEPTIHLSPKVGLFAFVVGAIAITIPSPGGMGTYHLLVTSLLAIYGIAEADAFSFANIIFFSVQIGVNVILGIIALIFLPILNKNYQPQHAEMETVKT